MMIVIWESLKAFKYAAPQVARYKNLFIKLASMDQMRWLLLYQLPCCIATSLSELLDFIYGSVIEFLRLFILEDFNLPSLEMR